MPMRRKDKELSKYSKARMDFNKNKTSSERARVARSLAGVLLGGAALARVHSRVPVLALRAFSDGASRELSRS